MIAFMYLVPLLVFWLDKGRHYYVAEAYPMLIAMGAVTSRTLADAHPRVDATHRQAVFFAGLFTCGAFFFAGWFLLRRAARCVTSPSGTAGICARRSAGMNSSGPSPGFAIPFPLTSKRTSASLLGNYGE